MKASAIIVTIISFVFILQAVVNFASPSKKNHQTKTNHPPVVKIINPKASSLFEWNTQVNYQITVSDKEDGDSKYDEINTKEVLLEVRYIKDTSNLQSELSKPARNDAGDLALMRASNCFNCHNFTGKLIGPSFYDISKKYPYTSSNIALLAKRITDGTTGIWGKVTMPKHPELSKSQAQTIVEWILQNAANQAVHYYIGTEGFFKANPLAPQQKGAYILIASYIDHGVKDDTAIQHLPGRDVILIKGK